MVTGWKGGADIGLGLLYMFLPLYSVVFMALGYVIGEIIGLIRQRNFQRWPILGRYVWPNPRPIPRNYKGEIKRLKKFLANRAEWIDKRISSVGR